MAKFIKIYEENPNEKQVREVVNTLRNGGLVIFPTDTVYSLGCDINNPKALKKLAQIKGVNIEKAKFSFITDSLSNLSDYIGQISNPTFKLLKRALPGAYTFIMPSNSKLPKPFKKKKTVGIRIPDNAIISTIVKELGNPVASTSIKDDDEFIEYATDPEEIFKNWQNKVDIVIDGGFGGNKASSVIDVSSGIPELIRKGKGSIDVL